MNRKPVFLTPAGSSTPPESAVRAIRAAQKNGHMGFSAQNAIPPCSRPDSKLPNGMNAFES